MRSSLLLIVGALSSTAQTIGIDTHIDTAQRVLVEGVDLILMMKDGRVQAFGPKEEVLGQVLQRVQAAPPIKIVSDGGVAKVGERS